MSPKKRKSGSRYTSRGMLPHSISTPRRAKLVDPARMSEVGRNRPVANAVQAREGHAAKRIGRGRMADTRPRQQCAGQAQVASTSKGSMPNKQRPLLGLRHKIKPPQAERLR